MTRDPNEHPADQTTRRPVESPIPGPIPPPRREGRPPNWQIGVAFVAVLLIVLIVLFIFIWRGSPDGGPETPAAQERLESPAVGQ